MRFKWKYLTLGTIALSFWFYFYILDYDKLVNWIRFLPDWISIALMLILVIGLLFGLFVLNFWIFWRLDELDE